MPRRWRLIPLLLLAVALLNVACVTFGASREEKMDTLAGQLLRLTAAVEGTVRWGNPPPGISDDQLLELSTQEDPTLLEPFKPFIVHVKQEGNDVILLVCTEDGKEALLEDHGGTTELDKRLWQLKPPVPCQFTLGSGEMCPR